MNEKIAYAAMFDFLDNYYQITKSDDVGGLLGGMSLLIDGSTADPAIWEEWLESVKKAKANDVDLNLNLTNKDYSPEA